MNQRLTFNNLSFATVEAKDCELCVFLLGDLNSHKPKIAGSCETRPIIVHRIWGPACEQPLSSGTGASVVFIVTTCCLSDSQS